MSSLRSILLSLVSVLLFPVIMIGITVEGSDYLWAVLGKPRVIVLTDVKLVNLRKLNFY